MISTGRVQHADIKRNRSVQRAARLLKALSSARQGMTLTELSKATGLPESTVYRLLATLEEEELVERAEDGTGRFLMGLEMYHLGSVVLDRLGIGSQVLSELEGLAGVTGETVNLGALHGFHVLYLQKVESQHMLRASLTVGSATVPAYCSGNGKVLLAHLEDARLQALLDAHPLERWGPNTIVERERLLDELSRIRADGYAVDNLEYAADIRAVAAPVRDHSGGTIAAVAVAGPASRVTLERAHALAPDVMAVAARISERLGYHARRQSGTHETTLRNEGRR